MHRLLSITIMNALQTEHNTFIARDRIVKLQKQCDFEWTIKCDFQCNINY